MSPIKAKRQECEVYSRVNGYYRPISQWNDAKIAEHKHRTSFRVENSCC
ncbi:MAG: anaerobic ribonucleoside-triphosphate reductase [Patescibacteria group bacterium]|nr:anaerobic ribonucleoside-triphosphate reductase [Patescibacteria group bacterium]